MEERIQDPKDVEFVKQKISEISILFLDTIDKITEMSEQKMKRIEETQKNYPEINVFQQYSFGYSVFFCDVNVKAVFHTASPLNVRGSSPPMRFYSVEYFRCA